MAAPLSRDLRLRIVAARVAGAEKQAIAERFDVGIATVYRVLRRYAQTGDVEPGKTTGRKRRLDDEELSVLRGLVLEKPDRLLAELLDLIEQHTGKRIGQATLSRSLAAMGLTRKKSVSTRRKSTLNASRKRAANTRQ